MAGAEGREAQSEGVSGGEERRGAPVQSFRLRVESCRSCPVLAGLRDAETWQGRAGRFQDHRQLWWSNGGSGWEALQSGWVGPVRSCPAVLTTGVLRWPDTATYFVQQFLLVVVCRQTADDSHNSKHRR